MNKDKPAARRGKVQLIDAIAQFEKMRKSVGSKRNQITTDQIQTIAETYRGFAESETSKLFDTTDFFYRTITVERPLRLNFTVSPERVERALTAKQLAKLGDGTLDDLRKALGLLGDRRPGEVWLSRSAFQKILCPALKDAGVALKPPQMKALVAGLAEFDDDAEVAMAKGKPEPSSDLRDTENVPWDEDIHAYFDREVKPYVPDAWIDESKTKDGCEIPFTRHFYKYTPPRPLEEIDRDLEEVLGRIRDRLNQVTG